MFKGESDKNCERNLKSIPERNFKNTLIKEGYTVFMSRNNQYDGNSPTFTYRFTQHPLESQDYL